MGNVTSLRLDIHRFLGLAVCHSTTIDPRRMEHYNYMYWTADFAALIVRGGLEHCLLAPQFPIYVSPKERLDADTSMGSGKTTADGDAEGVYVDIAVVMPIVQPRHVEELGAAGELLDGKTLHEFFRDVLPERIRQLSPRCLWVSGFEAPVIGELKPGPTRHAARVESFYRNLIGLLRRAMVQVEAQAMCLFCSWRFGTQDVVILLAGAGDYYRIRLVTRRWAAKELGEHTYSPQTLQRLKAASEERGDVGLDSPDVNDVNALEDGDWTEGQMGHMYGNPLSAQERQKKLNDQRAARRTRRDAQRQQYLKATSTPPSTDRTAPPFTKEALNGLARGGNFFESRPPQLPFGAAEAQGWSRVLQLGSEMSNQYMESVQAFIRRCEIREDGRREGIRFHKAT